MNRFSQMQTVLDLMKPSVIIRLGGAGNKALHILDEYADLLLHMTKGIKFWDMCASEALMRGRFGIVSDKDMAPIIYDHTLKDFTLQNGIIMSRNEEIYKLCLERTGEYLKTLSISRGKI